VLELARSEYVLRRENARVQPVVATVV
jgi:hypothetical protein